MVNKNEFNLYRSGEFNQKYKTTLDNKVKPIHASEELSKNDINSFADKKYSFFETTQPLVLYRVYGKFIPKSKNDIICGSGKIGRFVTTEFAESVIDVKMRLALEPFWMNTKMYEAKLIVPIGEIIIVGKVAPVRNFPGGADQIMLRANWPSKWIVGYRKLTMKQLHEIPTFYPTEPKEIVTNDELYK